MTAATTSSRRGSTRMPGGRGVKTFKECASKDEIVERGIKTFSVARAERSAEASTAPPGKRTFMDATKSSSLKASKSAGGIKTFAVPLTGSAAQDAEEQKARSKKASTINKFATKHSEESGAAAPAVARGIKTFATNGAESGAADVPRPSSRGIKTYGAVGGAETTAAAPTDKPCSIRTFARGAESAGDAPTRRRGRKPAPDAVPRAALRALAGANNAANTMVASEPAADAPSAKKQKVAHVAAALADGARTSNKLRNSHSNVFMDDYAAPVARLTRSRHTQSAGSQMCDSLHWQ